MILREQTSPYRIEGYLIIPRWFFKIKKEDFAKWGYEFIIEDETRDWVKVSYNDKYLIFTNSGTFEVSDSLIGFVRFDSSDVYGSIEVGKTYNFKLRGYRVPILSMYQNIESFELVEN